MTLVSCQLSDGICSQNPNFALTKVPSTSFIGESSLFVKIQANGVVRVKPAGHHSIALVCCEGNSNHNCYVRQSIGWLQSDCTTDRHVPPRLLLVVVHTYDDTTFYLFSCRPLVFSPSLPKENEKIMPTKSTFYRLFSSFTYIHMYLP